MITSGSTTIRRSFTRATRGVLAGVLAGAALLALPAPSPAATITLGKAGGLKYVRGETTVAAASGTKTTATTKAGCGRRWRTGSVGAAITGDAGVSALSQLKPDTRATYGGGFHAAQPDQTLYAYAVCTKSDGISSNAQVQQFAPAPAALGVTSNCTEGHVIGGGAIATAPLDESFVNTTMPVDGTDADEIPDDGWRAFQQLLDGTGVNGVVYDICRKGPAPRYRSASEEVDAFAPLTLKARCNGGHVIGGGVFVSGPADDAHVVASVPYDSADPDLVPDDAWFATVANRSPAPLQATVHAICVD
jgi:hypothetical protein